MALSLISGIMCCLIKENISILVLKNVILFLEQKRIWHGLSEEKHIMIMVYVDSFHMVIQKLRKAHGLTQEEAAIKLNISDRHMRSLEKGTYAPLDLFVEIAVHFDVTLDYLILGKVETKTELALSKKINDQKQAMKSLREQLLAFAMEIEVE